MTSRFAKADMTFRLSTRKSSSGDYLLRSLFISQNCISGTLHQVPSCDICREDARQRRPARVVEITRQKKVMAALKMPLHEALHLASQSSGTQYIAIVWI